MKRPKIAPIPPILLRSPRQVAYASSLISAQPLDPECPIEVIIREQVKQRKKTLNDAMWAGPLADIARQAWHNDRQYSADEWHEGFKVLFLPCEDDPEFDPSHVVHPETYRKWSINPITGARMCVGSTTQLTDAGMRVYLLQMEAFAAKRFHVQFTTRAEPLGYMPRSA